MAGLPIRDVNCSCSLLWIWLSKIRTDTAKAILDKAAEGKVGSTNSLFTDELAWLFRVKSCMHPCCVLNHSFPYVINITLGLKCLNTWLNFSCHNSRIDLYSVIDPESLRD